MKSLLLISTLIILVGCGKTKVVEKEVIKEVEIIVDETKVVVDYKVYGKHVQVSYDDGTKEWFHPDGWKPVEDLAAHEAKVIDYITWKKTTCKRTCQVTIEKLETLMGDGWVVLRHSEDGGYDNTFAVNLGAFAGSIPDYANLENGHIFTLANNLDRNIEGIYNTTGEIEGVYNHNSYNGTINYIPSDPYGGMTLFFHQFPNPDSWVGNPSTNYSVTEADVGIENFSRENFYFEESAEYKKDLESMAFDVESEMLVDFGLSEEKSIKIARLANHYSKLISKRALTAKEKDLFTKELTGLSFEKAAEMMVHDYDGLIEKAAELNETSPEAIKELISEVM